MSRKNIGPVLFHKIRTNKEARSPVIYGWQHNSPFSKQNNFSYFWSEKRPIRKTVVNHVQRVKQVRSFGERFDFSPEVMQELSQDGPFTLFCPTNAAMDMIKEAAWDKLWDQERALFMRNHVIRGKWGIEDLAAAAKGETRIEPTGNPAHFAPVPMPELPLWSLAEQPLNVEVSGSLDSMNREVQIAGAKIEKANIRCWNGYVHFVDKPLVPRWR